MAEEDPSLIVEVFDDFPGGYLPVGEFGQVLADLAAARERIDRLSTMIALARVLWMSAGFVVGLACGVMLRA